MDETKSQLDRIKKENQDLKAKLAALRGEPEPLSFSSSDERDDRDSREVNRRAKMLHSTALGAMANKYSKKI